MESVPDYKKFDSPCHSVYMRHNHINKQNLANKTHSLSFFLSLSLSNSQASQLSAAAHRLVCFESFRLELIHHLQTVLLTNSWQLLTLKIL